MSKEIRALEERVAAAMHEQHEAHARAAAYLKDRCDFMAAQQELTTVLLRAVRESLPQTAQDYAIAAAQVKGEQLAAEAPKEIAAHYATLVAGIAPKN